MDVQQGNTTSPTTTATTSTVGRPCAQCQSRHLSCDRQRPCRRCVEAGPGLAMNCCDPTDAPRKRGRPPGACRKRRSTTAPTALATPTPPTVLYPAPKRARAEPGSLLVPPPVPFAGPQPAAASTPLPQQAWASPADDPTGLWDGAPQGSGQQSSSPPLPQSSQQVATTAPGGGGGGQPAEPDVMRAILHELREMRSAYTTLSAQVADLTKRQTTTDHRIDALHHHHHHHNHNQPSPHQLLHQYRQSQFEGASAAMTAYYGSDGGIGPARRLSASWQELADLFNSAPFVSVGSPPLPSPLPSPFPSSQGLLTRMWSMSQPSMAPPPPGYSSSPFSSLSSSSSFFSSSSSSSLSSPSPSPSLLYLPSPPLPPTVPMHSFDRHHPRVLAVLPNNQLSSSFDRPWLIERMASDARLPKHQFPDPSLFQFFGSKRPLTVAANDQFRQLMRYTWGELHELNTAWFYPPSAMQVMAVWFRDWIGKRQPACLSPVFLTTCPLVTRDGQLLHSLARTQLYYDEQGDYSWSLTVLEYWRYVEHDSESEEATRQVSEELEVLLRDCHPSPCVDLPQSSSSPESTPSTPSPATFASPPTVSTDEYAALLKTMYAQGLHHP